MFRRVRGARKDWTNGPAGTTTGAMEPRKYSTGTKGRIKMHCDKCREFIRANASFNLATEFIESIDPDHDEQVWQRFQTPADILPELQPSRGSQAPPGRRNSANLLRRKPPRQPCVGFTRNSRAESREACGLSPAWRSSTAVARVVPPGS